MKAVTPDRLFAYALYLFAFSAPVSIVAAQIAAGLIIVIGAVSLFSDIQRTKPPFWESIFLLLFLSLVLLSSILSPEAVESIPQLRKGWVLFCFFPIVMLPSAFSKVRVSELLVWGTVLASALAIYRFLTGAVDRAAPYSGGYTTLALFEAAMIPFVIAFYCRGNSSKKWLYIIALLIIGVGLILTKTRAGWSAAIAGALIMGYSLNWKRTIIGLGLGLIVLAAFPMSRNIVLERFASNKKGGFSSGRTLIYRAASEPLSHLPILGYGPGSFRRLVPYSVLEESGDTGISSWHSTPLEILMESGPLAVLALLGIAGLPLGRAWNNRKKSIKGLALHWALLSSLIALYLAGLSTNLIRDFMLLSLLTMLYSITMAGTDRNTHSIRKA